MNRRSMLVFPVAVLAISTGCTAEQWEQVDPYLPKVKFKELVVNEVDWDGVAADFVFDVENPNPVDVKLASFDYALAFEGVEWLSGDDPDGLVLGASGGSELALPTSFEWEGLYEMVQAVRGQDQIGFGLDGSFGFDTPVGKVDLPYAEDGGFPAPRRPKFTLNKIKVQDLSLTQADLALKVDVDNDHGSNLIFQNVDYRVSLAGVDVGGGFLDSLGEVDGASSKVMSIPVTVDFLDVGSAVRDWLQGEKLAVDLSADMDVDTPFGLVPLHIDEADEILVER